MEETWNFLERFEPHLQKCKSLTIKEMQSDSSFDEYFEMTRNCIAHIHPT